ncbi:PhzF family phenazine biosynthesis protein [Kribbella sp. DT2]|uniref:PhzF family phenazine biosynthesis protein n=1 Tax=Kribbella sp. DT2 TaxID=3393427 RepID=UPI003CE82C86
MTRRTARVFTADNGAYGNEVAVVLVAGMPSADERQHLATGATEPATVFVAEDLRTVRIHNRLLERRFAGHPLLGTAAVLRSLGHAPSVFATEAGEVEVWAEGSVEWLFAPANWSPDVRHRQAESPAGVEGLTGAPADEPVQVWAWLDEVAGVVRARMFAPSEGKPEDEACGSASMVLAGRLGRELRVVHGRGSVIRVRPEGDGVRLGGRCLVTGAG